MNRIAANPLMITTGEYWLIESSAPETAWPRPGDSSDVAVTVALDQSGMVLLVAGAVVVLVGLVVIAVADRHKQPRCAMDPRRCSVACRGLTSGRPRCPQSRGSGSVALERVWPPGWPGKVAEAQEARANYYLQHDH